MHVARSLRLRLAVLYSAVLVVLAGLLMLGVYLALAHSLDGGAVPDRTTVVGGAQARVVTAQELERQVNQHALERLQDYSLAAIGFLFVASLLVGWVVAGRALAPVDRVTRIARDIGATSLERRIRLGGPDDELRRLADTFDDMVERLDDAFRGQRSFAADASHELRNPIAVVQANADLLLSEPDDPATVRVRAGRIRAASERLARLGDDLLALARLDEQRPRREVGRARPAARGPRGRAGGAGGRGRRRRWRCTASRRPRRSTAWPCGAPWPTSSRTRCATRRAGSAVRLASGEQGRWAWIAVEDDGPGIDAAHRARVFDRFYRVDRARSRADGGSGLGLAIVREVARAHGGDVRLHSEPGQRRVLRAVAAGPPGPRRRARAAAARAVARASRCADPRIRTAPASSGRVPGRRVGRRLAPVAPRAESPAPPPELGAPPLSWVRGAPTRGGANARQECGRPTGSGRDELAGGSPVNRARPPPLALARHRRRRGGRRCRDRHRARPPRPTRRRSGACRRARSRSIQTTKGQLRVRGAAAAQRVERPRLADRARVRRRGRRAGLRGGRRRRRRARLPRQGQGPDDAAARADRGRQLRQGRQGRRRTSVVVKAPGAAGS